MSWDEDCQESCHCSCAGCSLHLEEYGGYSPSVGDDPRLRLNSVACDVLGHKPHKYSYAETWIECIRCGETLSGGRPSLDSLMARSFSDASRAVFSYVDGLLYGGARAVLVDIKDPGCFE